MSQEYLQSLHATFQTPEQHIFELVRRASGQEPEVREQLMHGYDSEVYRVTTQQQECFIVRIHHHGGVDYAQEAWAIEQARAAGVPVPEIILLEQISSGEQQYDAMVQRCVPGKALSEREPQLTGSQRIRVWGAAGELLGRLHSIPVGGFYRRNSNGDWDFPDWEALMHSHIAGRTAEVPLLLEHGFSEADTAFLLDVMERYRREFPCTRPVLCHGDFLPGHIFVDDDLHITGLIDFGEFHGGPPIGDISLLSTERPDLNLRWLQAGYGDPEVFDQRFEERLLLHNVGLQIGYLAHYLRERVDDEIALATRALEATIAGLR